MRFNVKLVDLRVLKVVRSPSFLKFQLALCLSFVTVLPAYAAGSSYDRSTEPDAAYYRYTTPAGNSEMGRNVPPASVKFGYQVLDKRMRLIRTVSPALTAEVLAEKAQEKKQQMSDDLLLQTFASYEDAERARDRKIAALDVIVTISEGNILRLNLEYETLAQIAANKQRQGKPIPEKILNNMENVERQIVDAQAHIASKEKEKAKIVDEYQPDIDRLKTLEGVTDDSMDETAKASSR